MKIPERIERLQKEMEAFGMDAYLVPTADFHESEYVGEYFKSRQFITGFTGSAGTALITREGAYLWTDGRYFIQAAAQLEGSGVELMKMGEPGVPTIQEFLKDRLPAEAVLGFDGRTVTVGEGRAYEAIAAEKGGKVLYGEDLIGRIWEDRPELSREPVFALDLKYAGESTASKLQRVREEMKAQGADRHVLTTLDDICWLLNVRGNDVEFFPLLLSYAVIDEKTVDLYVDETKFSDEIRASLEKDGVVMRPYNDIYEKIKEIPADSVLLLDPDSVNYALYRNIPEQVKKKEARNPEILFKAVKNPVEIENIRKAQIKDSVAHVKFMKWLKENYDKEVITEISASDRLDEFRKEQGNFIRPSFDPISSFGEHGAIVHYSSTPETNVPLKAGGFLMTDTGAGFWEGSTDITRTYALGEVTPQMKEHFTLVAVSNLRLADAKFLKGCTGVALDILARKPFWDKGVNFNHGTGHGVGYLLNIHEGPAGFRWRERPGEAEPLQAGMILTDEPGIYIEGSHGIRLENELLICEGEKNEYGQFMYTEPITFVPMDLDAIDPSVMTQEDRKLLNDYHRQVYEKVSPYLDEEEKEWLKKYTREI